MALQADAIEAVARALTDCPDEWDEHEKGDKDVFRRMAQDGVAAYLSCVPLVESLRDLLEVTEGQDAEWDDAEESRRRSAIHERAHAILATFTPVSRPTHDR